MNGASCNQWCFRIYYYQESSLLALLIQDNVEIRKWSFLLKYYFIVPAWKGYPLHPLKKLLKHQRIVFDALFKSSHSLPVGLETCVPSWVMRIVGQSFYFTVKWLYSKLSVFPSREQATLFPWAPQVITHFVKSHDFKNMSKCLVDLLN